MFKNDTSLFLCKMNFLPVEHVINAVCQELVFTFTGVKEGPKGNDPFATYISKIASAFSNGNASYVIAMVPYTTSKIPLHTKLSNIPWTSLSTRELNDNDVPREWWAVTAQKWELPPPSVGLNFPLTFLQRHDNYTEYTLEVYGSSCVVTLLHKKSTSTHGLRNTIEYPKNMKLIQSLLTYSCVIASPRPTKIDKVDPGVVFL